MERVCEEPACTIKKRPKPQTKATEINTGASAFWRRPDITGLLYVTSQDYGKPAISTPQYRVATSLSREGRGQVMCLCANTSGMMLPHDVLVDCKGVAVGMSTYPAEYTKSDHVSYCMRAYKSWFQNAVTCWLLQPNGLCDIEKCVVLLKLWNTLNACTTYSGVATFAKCLELLLFLA